MTKRREKFLKEIAPRDFKFVSINECEFDEMYEKCCDSSMRKDLELEMETTFADARGFYFGGRVNAIVLLEECDPLNFEMKYFDFTSLYPAVMKAERYPFGEFITI